MFKRCENCHRLRFRWQIKKQKIFVKAINQVITGQKEICGRCKKVVIKAIEEHNV